MHPPGEFLGPYDQQRLPEAGYVPAHLSGRRRSRAIWLRVEIGRSGPATRADARQAPTGVAADPAYSDRIRGWFDRILRPGPDDQRDLPTSGVSHSSGREPAASGGSGHAADRPAAISFWEQLSPPERVALLSVAQWVKFSTGDWLMREGDPADCVIVIIEGQARVCVDENGRERVLAERGPGQLVGERGGLHGLQVRVRSASVIAIEPVWGLRVTTADFSAFVDRYPRVLDIVEGQLYDRLAEDRARFRDHSMPGNFRAASAPRLLSGHNCTVLRTDVVAFGSPARNDEDRRIIRQALFEMTNMTLRGVGGAWSEDRGDGILTVIPPDIPTAEITERLVKELPLALARHNTTVRDSARFRLRAAINVGPVAADIMGVNGEAIIVASRLVEAPIFKEAVSKTHAELGVIADSFVYNAVIRHNPNPVDVVGYSQIEVSLKGFAAPAWMKLFYASPSLFSLSPSMASSY